MRTARWLVEDGKFRLSGGTDMQAGCHHTNVATRACGGCYARLSVALERIEKSPDEALSIVKAVQAAMRAEKPKGGRRG